MSSYDAKLNCLSGMTVSNVFEGTFRELQQTVQQHKNATKKLQVDFVSPCLEVIQSRAHLSPCGAETRQHALTFATTHSRRRRAFELRAHVNVNVAPGGRLQMIFWL